MFTDFSSERWLSKSQQQVWRAYLYATSRLMNYLNECLDEYGLSFSEYQILMDLSEAPQQRRRMSELSESLQFSRSRISHAVARLEKLGYIYRESDENDGRGVCAVLSELGQQVLTQAAPAHVESVRQLFVDPVCADDYEALGRAMSCIAKADLTQVAR